LQEVARIGFQRMLIPRMELPPNGTPEKLQLLQVATIGDTIKACFSPRQPGQSEIDYSGNALIPTLPPDFTPDFSQDFVEDYAQ
jgi:hypothetical protein